MFVVYVIESAEGYRYTGFTGDLIKRVDQHNSGIAQWTKRGSGWRVIYAEEYGEKGEALRRERWLKTGVGREFLQRKLDGS